MRQSTLSTLPLQFATRFLLLFIFLSIQSLNTLAQDQIQTLGLIIDGDSIPMVNAKIVFYSQENNRAIESAYSDTQGRFRVTLPYDQSVQNLCVFKEGEVFGRREVRHSTVLRGNAVTSTLLITVYRNNGIEALSQRHLRPLVLSFQNEKGEAVPKLKFQFQGEAMLSNSRGLAVIDLDKANDIYSDVVIAPPFKSRGYIFNFLKKLLIIEVGIIR